MSVRPETSSQPAEAGGRGAAIALGLVVLTVSWGLLHLGFWNNEQIIDTPVYQGYGEKVLEGQVPYRDFSLEYPPGALPVFVLPALAEHDDYARAFDLLMWLFASGVIVLVATTLAALGASAARLYGATLLVGVAPLLIGSVIVSRFDLWPVLLVSGALAAFVTERDRFGFGLLGLATAAKLYPGVILPVAFLWIARRRGWREAAIALAVFFGVVLAVFLPFAVLSPGGLWDSLSSQLGRPLQIESLGSALLLVAHQLGVYDPTVVSTHGSQNLEGSFPDTIAAMLTAVQVVALVAVWMLAWRGSANRERLLAASAAAVVAFIAFGKVLSPQFLIWLIPLVPLVGGSAGLAACAIFAVTLVTTQLWFPYRYWDVVALGPEAWLVLVRDLLLAGLFAAVLVAIRQAREETRSA